MNFSAVKVETTPAREHKSMAIFGASFVMALPRNVLSLKIPSRKLDGSRSADAIPALFDDVSGLQEVMMEVLDHPVTRDAEKHTERALSVFLERRTVDDGFLNFLNGWNDTHKTTSLVSAKILMRLASDLLFVPIGEQPCWHKTIAHMHEVAKDDFGLGHQGHDGMFKHMASAFAADAWVEYRFRVPECADFADFLYEIGVAEHKAPINSGAYNNAVLTAMMVSVASETWNGREFNYVAQYIEGTLLRANPRLAYDAAALRNAKSYVIGHAGEVENKHGLHALAAAQKFAKVRNIAFRPDRLKEVMLDYNARVGCAFRAMHRALVATC